MLINKDGDPVGSNASWELSDDRKRIVITMRTAQGRAMVRMDAAKLDAFIAELGQARAALLPAHAPVKMGAAAVATVNNSPFELGSAPGSSDRIVQLLDPRFGPVAFRFGENAAKSIGEGLVAGRKVGEL